MEWTKNLMKKSNQSSLLDYRDKYEERGFSIAVPENVYRDKWNSDQTTPHLKISPKVLLQSIQGKLLFRGCNSPEKGKQDSFASIYYFRNRLEQFIINLSTGKEDDNHLHAQESKFLNFFQSPIFIDGNFLQLHESEENFKQNANLRNEMLNKEGLWNSSSTLDNSSEYLIMQNNVGKHLPAPNNNAKRQCITNSLKKKGPLKKKCERSLDKNCIKIEYIFRGRDKRTTVMIRNIPNKYTLSWLMNEVNTEFKSKYDLIYLPLDNDNHCNLGFAFINFIDPLHIIYFYSIFQGRHWAMYKSEKICSLAYGKIQGLAKLISAFGKGNNANSDSNSLHINNEAKASGKATNIIIPIKYEKILNNIYPWAHYCIYNNKITIFDLF